MAKELERLIDKQ